MMALVGVARASGIDDMPQFRDDPLIGGIRVVRPDLAANPAWARIRLAIGDQAKLRSGPLAPWIRWATRLRDRPALDRIRLINHLVNRAFPYDTDQRIWGRKDYWETPLEMAQKGRADCEGFVIFKIFLGLIAGIEPDDFAVLAGIAPDTGEAHAVLMVVVDGVGYVLDNRRPEILRTADYPGLTVVYAADFDNAWLYPLALSGL